MESHGRSFFPIQEIGDICNSPGALKFKYVKLLLPPIHPIYTSYRPVSLALQPFTETWKNFAGYSLHLTSETLWKIPFSMSNHTTSEWKLNVWWIEKWWWRRRGEALFLAPNFPSISAYRCAPSNSRVLKSFFFLPIFRYRFLPKACFATHSSFDWKMKYLMGMIDAYELAWILACHYWNYFS